MAVSYALIYRVARPSPIRFTEPVLTITPKDTERVRPNPYIAIARSAFAEVKSLAAEFGLTPANRTAIIANALTAEKSKRELDPMEQILTSTSLDDVIVVGEEESDGEEN